jgi:outer membrane protein assembly factor BamB
MTIDSANESKPRKPLRLWPGVIAAALVILPWPVLSIVAPERAIYGLLAAVVFGLVIVVWWLFFSRAPWLERVGALAVMIAAPFAIRTIVDRSIENAGMGNMMFIFSLPLQALGLVAWAAASRRLSTGPRRASMAAAIVLACGLLAVVRTGGVSGDGMSDIHWRWTPTPEQKLLAQGDDEPRTPAPAPPAATTPEPPQPATNEPPPPSPAPATAKTPEKPVPAPTDHETSTPAAHAVVAKSHGDWPGFRGPNRDSVIHGVQIETDWSKSPPVELWRRKIGPGWSSFAVGGDVIYTQEQRGEDEIVSAYSLTSGEPVWRHRDRARFYESNGGAGPRGTPAVNNGRVYAFGATAIVNALDARTGKVVWTRNAATDTGAKEPGWGFASSPLVIDDAVVVAASGRLVAYGAATGQPRWIGPAGGAGYSSPHLVTIDGVPQILLMRGARTTSVAVADGTQLWEHSWQPSVSIVQPALAADGEILVASGDMMGGIGIRDLAVSFNGDGGWTVEERWTSTGLKPYFNDFVVHKGHAFGFDGSILACLDVQDGKRKWKGGRYGHGQLVLLADQDLLLVLSEEGELALVKAAADQFTEVARFPVLEGKTWNHPVLVGDVLLVRNGEEMAAFRLSTITAVFRSR